MILVTGAGGNVGTALVEAMKARGHKFRAGHHSSEKAAKARRDGYDVVQLDFAAPQTLAPAFAGVETLFLLGTGVRGQIEQETNVVNAAKAVGVKRLVKQSVWGAAREQYSLAKMHRAIERAVEASGIAWTFLRPNGFMQNFADDMAGPIKEKGAIFQPAGDAKISHIDVRDIARVAERVLTTPGHEGKAYELSGPEALSYDDAAGILSRVLGKKVTYTALTDEAARAGMRAAGLPDFYADTIVDLFRAYRDGIASQVTAEVKRITGRPPIAFEQFARDHAAQFR
ncbi:MAG: SDR family oxidoreductase [Rhizobiales bacterium]|nr:SDR family oxidoreductase [Hyphomicrobiales bacterium]